MKVKIKMNKSEMMYNEKKRMKLKIKGKDKMGIMLYNVKKVKIDNWSMDDKKKLDGNKWNGSEKFFIYYAYA
jgi:hypothetical protein